MAKKLTIELEVVDKGGVRVVGQTGEAVEDLGEKSEKTGSRLSRTLQITADFVHTVRGLGTVLRSAIGVAKGWIEASNVQESATGRLRAALVGAGEATTENMEALQAMADQLQMVAGVGDETGEKMAALAINFGASAEEALKIVPAAADMAAALEMDMESAIRNVSKTLGGYAGELGEVIPQLRGLTAEQLKAGEGITLLAELYEGQAAAASDTYAGKVKALEGVWGDFQEQLGDTLKVGLKPVVEAMAKGVTAVSNFFNAYKPAIIVTTVKVFTLLADAMLLGVKVAMSFANAYAEVRVAFARLLNWISPVIKAMRGLVAIYAEFTGRGAEVGQMLDDIIAGLEDNVNTQLKYRDAVVEVTGKVANQSQVIRDQLVGALNMGAEAAINAGNAMEDMGKKTAEATEKIKDNAEWAAKAREQMRAMAAERVKASRERAPGGGAPSAGGGPRGGGGTAAAGGGGGGAPTVADMLGGGETVSFGAAALQSLMDRFGQTSGFAAQFAKAFIEQAKSGSVEGLKQVISATEGQATAAFMVGGTQNLPVSEQLRAIAFAMKQALGSLTLSIDGRELTTNVMDRMGRGEAHA